MKYFVFASIFFALIITGNNASAASFNCRNAKLPSEVAICQNGELGRLDKIMARKYFRLKRNLPTRHWRELLAEQRRWLVRRNNCGYEVYCLEDSYVYRLRALNYWVAEYL